MSELTRHAASTTAGEDIVISVRRLVTRFGSNTVHDGVDLDVRRGEIMGVVGGSGTGKSVLLRCIVGLMRAAEGHIEILGREMSSLSRREHRAMAARWGMLFQDGALFSSLTVGENVQAPMREHTRVRTHERGALAGMKVAMVGLPSDACDKYPSELSGGMRKRAGLARALALDPEILFLDEPTAGLDPIGANDFDNLVGELRRSLGLTVMMITHDLDSLHAICDRVAVLVDKHVRVGTIDEHLHDPHPWIQAYFRGPRGRAALTPAETGHR